MSALPGGLEQAFRLAAGELGMCTASWLFTAQLGAAGGQAMVAALRDELGRTFPVLDFVATRWLRGEAPLAPVSERVVERCRGVEQLLVVGLETSFLDPLLPLLGGVRVSILTESPLKVDWRRVVANLGHDVRPVGLADFQVLAGRRSALLTFLYGRHGRTTHVMPAWLRVMGADVRTQFRTIVGWDVLGAPMYVYPRWLFEIPSDDFTDLL
ncbi:MAG: hypothetical protein AB2A00_34830 [Myxococcota bacterium]